MHDLQKFLILLFFFYLVTMSCIIPSKLSIEIYIPSYMYIGKKLFDRSTTPVLSKFEFNFFIRHLIFRLIKYRFMCPNVI